MTSQESSSPVTEVADVMDVTDERRLDWPAAMQARAAWLRRLHWLPGGRTVRADGSDGGLRLATSQWLRALARRPGLHGNVVRRSMGIWSSCAMDWRALGQQQASRDAGRANAAHAGSLASGGQALVHWHISERTIVQQGAIRYVAMPSALEKIGSAVMAGNEPAMTYVSSPVHRAAPTATLSAPASAKTTAPQAMQMTMPQPMQKAASGVTAAAAPRLASNAVAMTYVASSPRHEASPPPSLSAAPSEKTMAQQVVRQAAHEVAAATVVTATATPALADNAVDMSLLAGLSRQDQDALSSSEKAMPQLQPPLQSPSQSQSQSLDFFVRAQRKNTMKALQARPLAARTTASRSDNEATVQRVAASASAGSAWATPLPPPLSMSLPTSLPMTLRDVATLRADGVSPVTGDLLYDLAMRGQRDALKSPAGETRTAPAAAAGTTPPPLQFDLPRTRGGSAATIAAQAGERNEPSDNPAQWHGSGVHAASATGANKANNSADAPLRRDDIEHVAQRVMRIIARERRREREAKGIN